MIFDKNQSVFPSDFHREVWWWAVGLVPPSDSLTDKVKSQCGEDILEGCYQWYDYFNELCEDMYNHADIYSSVSARQYRDILEKIAANGGLQKNAVVRDIHEWRKYQEKFDKKVTHKLERCLNILERTGLKCEYKNEGIVFSNIKYPKIFHAMNTFEQSPNIKKTPARHHFAHCEFRQLFKSYSANYDELLRRVSEESRDIAHTIHDYAKSLKIQRYIHFDTIKYKHKNMRVLDFTVTGSEYPTLRVNIGVCANPDANADKSNDEFYRQLSAAHKNIQDIFEKNFTGSKIQINPFKSDLDAILCFIAARKASIGRYSGGN